MYGLSAGTKKSGRCREVAVVERWPLVEVRLYFSHLLQCTVLSKICKYRANMEFDLCSDVTKGKQI